MENTPIVLNEDNYVAWSDGVKSNLDAQNLWRIVESRSEPPNQQRDEAGFAEWKEANMKALQIIWHSLGNRTFMETYHIHSAHVAWSTLHEKYGMTDVINNLNMDNYLNWSNIVKSELRNQDLLNFVEPTPSPLDEEDSEVTLRDWRVRNFRALRVIWNFSAHKAFHEISMLDSAYIAWITLKTKYGTPSNSNTVGNTDLNNHSFMERVHQVKNELEKRRLWNIIESTSEPPRQEDDNAAFEQWRSNNFEALRLIWRSCEWKEFSAIEAEQSAKLAWEYLVTTFGGPHHIEIVKDFFKAVQRGLWYVIEEFLEHYPGLLHAKITLRRETALHVAVRGGNVHIVEMLVDRMSEKSLEIQNISNFTALDEATHCGNRQMVECMVRKNKNLTRIEASGHIPLTWAIICEHEELSHYLYSITPKEILMSGEPMHGAVVLQHAIKADMWDIAFRLIRHHRFLAFALDRDMSSPVLTLANTFTRFPNRNMSYWRRCFLSSTPFQLATQVQGSNSGLIHRFKKKVDYLFYQDILSDICQEIPNLNVEQRIRGRVIDAIFFAIKQGNVEFIYKIVRSNPDLIWSRDEDGDTIFMAAIRYRQTTIFSLICGLSEKNSMLACRDKKGNTLLHVAAMLPLSLNLKYLPGGAATEMQRETQWFKEVASICPRSCRLLQNDEGKTPHELFRESHENLRQEGERWMSNTANYCSVISAFIITTTFAAMITVPGGNNQDTGLPIFMHETWFLNFLRFNIVSFLAAIASLSQFLAVQTSGFSVMDFYRGLRSRMFIGLYGLFLSMLTITLNLFGILLPLVRGSSKFLFLACFVVTAILFFYSARRHPLFVYAVVALATPPVLDRNVRPWF